MLRHPCCQREGDDGLSGPHLNLLVGSAAPKLQAEHHPAWHRGVTHPPGGYRAGRRRLRGSARRRWSGGKRSASGRATRRDAGCSSRASPERPPAASGDGSGWPPPRHRGSGPSPRRAALPMPDRGSGTPSGTVEAVTASARGGKRFPPSPRRKKAKPPFAFLAARAMRPRSMMSPTCSRLVVNMMRSKQRRASSSAMGRRLRRVR